VRARAGGAEYLATHIDALRKQNRNTLVVSAGDNIGAGPLVSGLFRDKPTIEGFNAMGVDISAVGNHEFDEGSAELLRMHDGGCHPVDGCQDGDGFAGADFDYLHRGDTVDLGQGQRLPQPGRSAGRHHRALERGGRPLPHRAHAPGLQLRDRRQARHERVVVRSRVDRRQPARRPAHRQVVSVSAENEVVTQDVAKDPAQTAILNEYTATSPTARLSPCSRSATAW
jgi:calcineurin-like phosphoesterase family protein